MSDAALIGRGTIIRVGDGASPEVFTAISESFSARITGAGSGEIEVTDFASTSRNFKLQLKDEGSLEFDIHYIPTDTQHTQLRSDSNDGTGRNYQLVFTDSPQTIWTFAARVARFEPATDFDSAADCAVSLRITGTPVQT